MTIYRKVYELTGYTYDGAAYCLEHKPLVESDEVGSIFLGDEWDCALTCDVCHEAIEVTEIG